MFICKECAKGKDLTAGDKMFRSRGCCEICDKPDLCYDYRSYKYRTQNDDTPRCHQ